MKSPPSPHSLYFRSHKRQQVQINTEKQGYSEGEKQDITKTQAVTSVMNVNKGWTEAVNLTVFPSPKLIKDVADTLMVIDEPIKIAHRRYSANLKETMKANNVQENDKKNPSLKTKQEEVSN